MRGFFVMKLPHDGNLGEAVSSHPDTLLFYHGKQIITTADYCDCASYIFSDLREAIPDLKIKFTADTREAKYPHDCVMNALVIGDMLFCKSDSISNAILDYANECGLRIIHTRQGYPACSVLAFGNNAITADRGMADLLKKNGVNTLLIRQGYISLPPHEYGFIGGASFVYDDKICFFGDVERHPDGASIISFVTENGYIPISLSSEDLVDFGGGVVL